LTIKAASTLRKCKHIFAPLSAPGADSVALSIASAHLNPGAVIEQIEFPMTQDHSTLRERWDAAARQVCDVLKAGHDACFLTLGDPLLYSTYIYLLRNVQRVFAGAKIQTIPGISAYAAVAALTNFPIGEGRQPVRIIPTADDLSVVERALEEDGTVVLMKIGKRLKGVLELLAELNRLDDAVLVSRAGMPDQIVELDLRGLRENPRDVGYLSVILVNPVAKELR
jgi:precorrin-2/cobalt-factor-2 C20-methyltransferase